jgi:hypothetical protein
VTKKKPKEKEPEGPAPGPVDVTPMKTPEEKAADYETTFERALNQGDPAALAALKRRDLAARKMAGKKLPKNADAIDKLAWVLRQGMREPLPPRIKGKGIASLLRALRAPAVQEAWAPVSTGRSLLLLVIEAVDKFPALHDLAFDLRTLKWSPLPAKHLGRKSGGRWTKSWATLDGEDGERKEIETFRRLLVRWARKVPNTEETRSFIKKEWKEGRWPRTREEEAEILSAIPYLSMKGLTEAEKTAIQKSMAPLPWQHYEPFIRPFARELDAILRIKAVAWPGRASVRYQLSAARIYYEGNGLKMTDDKINCRLDAIRKPSSRK